MPNSAKLASQLATLDARLQTITCEKLELLNQRKILIAKQEAELTLGFNQYASVELKISLFMSYFKGRDDIYPFRWESKNGRSGYSPACFNEWKQGICEKPQVSCTKCQHQAFKPYSQQAIYDHLIGKQTAGIYPLQSDNTTHVIVADFDKDDWLQAIAALSNTCDSLNIPHLIERSRSGNGGHIWIFFVEAVSASDARKLGLALLNRTMDYYSALSFSCFDRLFPNQDIIPEGGFGNLIALPLQFEPRKSHHSIFIDRSGNSYNDQWAKLAATQKVSPEQLQQLLNVLRNDIKTTPELGTNNNEADETLDLLPWQKLSEKDVDKISNCPNELMLVLADQIYIPIDKLPGKLTSKLKRCAVFSNPKFYKKQALRMSTFGTSRYVCSAHIESNYLMLPRGCLGTVESILQQQSVLLNYSDKRYQGEPLVSIKFTGKLKPQQSKAMNAMLKSDNGILVTVTGFGKTVVILALIAKRKVNTLILVHNRQLAQQWQAQAEVFLNHTEIGSLLGGKDKLSGQVDIATYQSLVSKNGRDINAAIENYGQIIVDECHHLPASNYESLIKSTRAKYIHGITATPKRRDGLEKLMHYQLGDVLYKAKREKLQFEQFVTTRETRVSFPPSWFEAETKPHISAIYQHLTTDERRNKTIVLDIVKAVTTEHSVMVLTERREHIEILSKLLCNSNIKVIELHGGISAQQRQQRIKFLKESHDIKDSSDPFVIVATGKYVGEGFDLPHLDTLFITLPIAWKGILTQYAGRIQREWSTKKQIRVYDYIDDFPMLKRMWNKREKGYRALGYKFDNDQ
ncbi:MAG: DEAD/DEAH box helicase family protein [Gammaproteobacteria bacterium]|nr:DEAD/DEAH box helicase family protein [Gammaproteobacteria bacterium]